jgi:predicted DNA-binding transcriptional regulator YafY
MADLKRINRMVGILSMIDRGGKVTPKGLAGHFGASERSIYRDIRDLVVDFPIRFDDEESSYRFVDGYSLKKIDLSPNEVRAVLVSKAAAAKLGKGVASAYDGLMKKIRSETGCKTEQRLRSASPEYWLTRTPSQKKYYGRAWSCRQGPFLFARPPKSAFPPCPNPY